MSVTTSKVIRLSFQTSGGKSAAITLPNPKAGLTKAVIQGVMESVIAKNAFSTASGDLIGIRDIKIVDTTTEDLYDPLEP